MEVKLDKRYPVAAGLDACWAVLSDIRAVAACMPGAQITSEVDATHFKGTVKSKVGPAVMAFNGDIEVQRLDAAAHALDILGKGADKAGSSASMQLAAHLEADGDASVLAGQATIVVSGKLAQFGSRLLVPVSDALLAQFAANFSAAAAAASAATVAPAPAEAAVAGGAPSTPAPTAAAPAIEPLPADGAAPPTPPAPPPASPAAAAAAPAPAPVQELDALALAWSVFKGWLSGLFGRRS